MDLIKFQTSRRVGINLRFSVMSLKTLDAANMALLKSAVKANELPTLTAPLRIAEATLQYKSVKWRNVTQLT